MNSDPAMASIHRPARGQFAWALYDWANSAFSAVIVTFVFATYFSQAIAVDPVTGTSQWGRAMTVSALLAAVLGPTLGAIADAGGRRKPWIFSFTWLCVVATALLWYAAPSSDWVLYTLVLVVIANVGLDMAGVFYNAMLNDLVPKERMGRLSGWAWGLGYFGGLCCLTIALFAFVQTETPLFGLDKDQAEHARATGPLVALWLALFSLPLFLLTPDRRSSGKPALTAIRQGLGQLRQTISHIRRYRTVGQFLLARMLYIDGLNTLFAFGGIYAAGTFGMELAEVITFGILLNVTGGIGAFGFAWLDDWFGSKRVILIALVGLMICGLLAVVTTSVTVFWIVGGLLGLFVGPTQAASRTLMAKLAPPAQQTEMFGLYALSGKVTAFLGPLVLSVVTAWAGNQRAGMATILAFFIAGFLLLAWLKMPSD
ncbi:MAG: MFS transporter [Alphaproteobacteria bacterium]|nr:MFS transporter [Alphaproteobacteria bacterium]